MQGDVSMGTGLLNRLFGTSRRKTFQEESLNVQKVKELIISVDIAEVTIKTHSLPRVDITFESYEGGPMLEVDQTDETLKIMANKEEKGVTFVWGNLPKCQLNVSLPVDIADTWDIAATSGKITADSIVTGRLWAKATSGVVKLSNITAGHLTANTTSGRLYLNEIKTEKLSFLANSGKAEVFSSYGDIRGQVGSGVMLISGVKGEELDVKAGSGKITLKEVYMKEALVRANSGDIAAENFWVETTNTSVGSGKINIRDFRGSVKGNANSGNINISVSENSNLDLKTGSGNIHVEFQDFELNTSYDIKTGSGDMITNLPMSLEKRGKHHLLGKTGNGDNLIRLRTGSGRAVLYTAKSSLIKQGKGNTL
jgi:DUF4097 and DUF4098 domain-containing protein YvlB